MLRLKLLGFDDNKFIVDSILVTGINNMGDYREVELITGGCICVKDTVSDIIRQIFRKG